MLEPPRCTWPGLAGNAMYLAYHDQEWGVPVRDDLRLLEKLILEGFQSGLSWLTILKKRENFRRAFDGFEPQKVGRYGDADVARLLADPGIVRSRAKIEAAVANARAYLDLKEAVAGSTPSDHRLSDNPLAALLWGMLPDGPINNRPATHGDVPAQTPLSADMAKELKSRGFRFIGPTTAYAFMQSVGMVNDHLVSCHRHGVCEALQRENWGQTH